MCVPSLLDCFPLRVPAELSEAFPWLHVGSHSFLPRILKHSLGGLLLFCPSGTALAGLGLRRLRVTSPSQGPIQTEN